MNESVGRLPASDHSPMQNGGLAAGVTAQSPLRHSPAAQAAAPQQERAAPLSTPPQLARSPLQSPPLPHRSPQQNVRTYIRPSQKASSQEHHSQQLGTAAQQTAYSHASQVQPRVGAAPSAYGNILQSQLTQQRKPPPAVVSTYSSGQQQAVSRAVGQAPGLRQAQPPRPEQKLSPIQQTMESVRTKMQQHAQDLQQHQQQQQRAAPLQHVQQQQRLSALHQHQRPTPLQQQQQQQQMQQRRHSQIQLQQQHPPQLQQQQQLQQGQASHLQQQHQQQQRRLAMHPINQQVKQSTQQRVAQSVGVARQPGEGQLLDHQYDMEGGAVPAQTANPSQQRHFPTNTHGSQQRHQVAGQPRQHQRQRVVPAGNFQPPNQPQRSYPAPPNVVQRQQQQVQQAQQQVFELFEQPLQATVIHQPQFNQQPQPQQFALVRQEEAGAQAHYLVSPRQQQHYDAPSVVIVDGVPQAATVQYMDQHTYDMTGELEAETSGGRVFLVGSDGDARPTAAPLRRQVPRPRGRGGRQSRGAHAAHHPHVNHNQPRMAPPAVAAVPPAGQNLGMVDLRNVSIEFEDSEMLDAPPACPTSASTELDLLAQACTEAAVDELAMCSSAQTQYVNVALTATSPAQRPPAGHAQVVSGHVVGSVAGQIVGSVAGQVMGSVAGQRTVAAGVRPVGGHEVRYVAGPPLSGGQMARVTSVVQPQLAPAAVQGRVATPGPAAAPTATPKKKYSLAEYNEMRKQNPPSRTDQVEFVFNPETGRYLAYKQAGASSPAPQQLKGQLAGQIAAVLDKTLVQTRVGSGASSPATCTTATEKSAEVYTPVHTRRLVPGKLAICSNCGTCSSDFNRCDFCKKALPASPKTVEVAKTLLATETTSSAAVVQATTTSVRVQVTSAPTTTRNRPPPPKPTPPPKRGRPRRRDNEEPVCLTISSDEEDAAATPSSPTLEPVLTPSEADPGAAGDGSLSGDELATRGVLGGGKPVAESDADWEREIQGVDDGSLAGSYLSERVRAVRVGSYRPPADEPVLFSTRGTRLRLPTAAPPHRQVALTVPPSCVHRLLAHLGSQLMVVFLYLTPASGGHVRRLLEMTDPSAAYFDPASPEEMHKRITIIFQDDMSDESRLVLMEVFRASLGEERVLEIPLAEANKILVRASPPQLAATLMASCDANTVQTLLQFPPPPASGAIAVTTDDYCCLEEEQFLNDVIIDFYLKYLVQSRLSEADRKRTHVFSSFFYKRLTTRPRYRQGRRPAEESAKVTAAEKRHARVKGWTKNVDIFDMDFLIVPINEHSHWFLAIICFPGLEGYRRLKDGQPCPPPLPRRMRPAEPPPPDRPKAATEPAGSQTPAQAQPIQIGSTLITPLPADPAPVKREPEAESLDDEDSDRDEADGDDEDLDAEVDGGDAADAGAEKEPAEAESEEGCDDSGEAECELETCLPAVCTDQVPETAVKQPCVLIFDSLAGASRTRVVATLREYLRIEYQVKKSAQRLFNKDTIPGYCAKVPQQNNFSDCGVYVLQYVESFFESPILDFHMPLLPLHTWFPIARARRKREQIARLIERLARRQNPAHNIVLPKLLFNSSPEMKKLLEEEQQQQQERWASPAKGGRGEAKSRGAKPAPAMVPRQVAPVMKIVRHSGPQGGKLVVKQILVQSQRAASPANPMLKPASGAAAAEQGRPAKTLVVPPSPTPRPPISRTSHLNTPKQAAPTVKPAASTASVASSPVPRPETSSPSSGTSGAAPRQQPGPAASAASPQAVVSKSMPTALKAPSGALVTRPGAVSSPPIVRASKQAAPQHRSPAVAAPGTARAAETAAPVAAVKPDVGTAAARKPDKAPQTASAPADVAGQPPERRVANTHPAAAGSGEAPEEPKPAAGGPAVSASSAGKGAESCGETPAPPAEDRVQATYAVEKRSPATTKAADAAPSETAAQERKPLSKPSTPAKASVSSSPLKLAATDNTPKSQVTIDKMSDAEASAASSPRAERAVRSKTNGADTGSPKSAPRVPSRLNETAVSQAGTKDNTVSPQVSVSPSKTSVNSPKASVPEAAAGVRGSVSHSPTPSRTVSRARTAAGGAPSASAVTRSRRASSDAEPATALVASAGLSAIAAGYASSSDEGADDAASTASAGEERTPTPDPQEGGLRRRAPRDYALMAGQKRRTVTPTPKDAVKEKVARKS